MPRHDHGLVTVSDRIYALGGLDSAEQQLSSVERYDPSTDEWSVFAEMPTGKHSFGCAVVKGLIYLVGGFSGPDRAKTSSVEVFNPVTKMWTEAASLATPRVWLRCVELQGKLYATEGKTSSRSRSTPSASTTRPRTGGPPDRACRRSGVAQRAACWRIGSMPLAVTTTRTPD